ncbi:MAG: putative kinase [Psychroserpens sp.]|jgi:predicted kinase
MGVLNVFEKFSRNRFSSFSFTNLDLHRITVQIYRQTKSRLRTHMIKFFKLSKHNLVFVKSSKYLIKMIHLIVGNTGSGKTTYSNTLKKETNGLIFSIDYWNKTLFYADKKSTDGLDWFLERIKRAELIILDLIIQLENAKIDSILDLGLSKFEHREKFRQFATLHGFEMKLYFLDIQKNTRLKRVLKRNEEKGDTFEFEVSKDNFNFMEAWFEKPTKDEIAGAILITE